MNWFKKWLLGDDFEYQQRQLESYKVRVGQFESQLIDHDKMKLRLTIYEECSGMKDSVEAAIEKITAQKMAAEQQRAFNQMAALQQMPQHLLGQYGFQPGLSSLAAQSRLFQ